MPHPFGAGIFFFDIFLPIVNGAKWVLESLSDLTGNTGIALILFTIMLRLLTLPLTMKSMRSALVMQELQPMVKEIQKEHKGDQQAIMQQTQSLYARYGASQFSGCLPALLQLPVFIILSSAVNALAYDSAFLATGFLWVPDLSKPDPLHILPVLSGLAQFVSVKMALRTVKDADTQVKLMNTLSTTLFPAMAVLFAWTWFAGPVIYWVTNSVIAAVQSYFINGWGSLREILPFLPTRKVRRSVLVQLSDDQIEANKAKKKTGMMSKMIEKSMEANAESERLKAERAGGGSTTSVTRPSASLRPTTATSGNGNGTAARKTAKVSGGYYSALSEELKREAASTSNGSKANGTVAVSTNGSSNAPARAPQLSYDEMMARRNKKTKK